jgi:hypothetical protein
MLSIVEILARSRDPRTHIIERRGSDKELSSRL